MGDGSTWLIIIPMLDNRMSSLESLSDSGGKNDGRALEGRAGRKRLSRCI